MIFSTNTILTKPTSLPEQRIDIIDDDISIIEECLSTMSDNNISLNKLYTLYIADKNINPEYLTNAAKKIDTLSLFENTLKIFSDNIHKTYNTFLKLHNVIIYDNNKTIDRWKSIQKYCSKDLLVEVDTNIHKCTNIITNTSSRTSLEIELSNQYDILVQNITKSIYTKEEDKIIDLLSADNCGYDSTIYNKIFGIDNDIKINDNDFDNYARSYYRSITAYHLDSLTISEINNQIYEPVFDFKTKDITMNDMLKLIKISQDNIDKYYNLFSIIHFRNNFIISKYYDQFIINTINRIQYICNLYSILYAAKCESIIDNDMELKYVLLDIMRKIGG